MKSSIAIVLGGTNPHIALIKNLKNRGYYTILVDYLENSPAKSFADKHIIASTLDKDAVLKIAKDAKAELVISACVDQANITACYVMEELGLKVPYSYETAYKITNKGVMKQIMYEKGIPTSAYIYVENNVDIDITGLNFPLMVKPADCNSSSGVKKANNIAEMREFLKDALNYSRNRRAVIEEFVTGMEVSAYCFIQNCKARIIMISERMSVIEGEDQVLKCYATLAPARISEAAYKRLEESATKIADSFGLNNTPLHVQAFITEDSISIIEFAPRVGGGISYQTIYDNTGFDIIDATVDSFLNIPVDVKIKYPRHIQTVNLIYGVPAIYDRIEGQDELIKAGIIEGIYYHKTKGTKISGEKAAAGRIAAYIIKAKDIVELVEKTSKANDALEAYSEKGEKIMRKDLNILRDLNLVKQG